MLEEIIREVKVSIDNKCFMAALALALMIPDACARVEYPEINNKKNSERYKKWFDTYVRVNDECQNQDETDFLQINGEIIYSLRNCVVHEGIAYISAKEKVDEYLLYVDDISNAEFGSILEDTNGKIIGKRLEINIVTLCNKLCLAAKKYYDENANKFVTTKSQIEDRQNDSFKQLFLEVSK